MIHLLNCLTQKMAWTENITFQLYRRGTGKKWCNGASLHLYLGNKWHEKLMQRKERHMEKQVEESSWNMEKHSSLMENRIKLKSYYYCTGLVKWGEKFLTIILQQNLLRLKHTAKQTKGNETFITEQINVNTSWITTGKNKKKYLVREKNFLQDLVVVVAVNLHIWLCGL
jgi:hypothetical protein